MEWIGRANSIMRSAGGSIDIEISTIQSLESASMTGMAGRYYLGIKQTFNNHIADLQLELGNSAQAIEKGAVFHYYEAIRTTLATAKTELFIIDPYVDAEVVPLYLAAINPTVKIRFLTAGGRQLSEFLPGITKLQQQAQSTIEVRSNNKLHDRFIFIDGKIGYMSGASLKDGGKNAPALVVEVIDGFDMMLQIYEDIWNKATVRFPSE